MGKVKEGSYIPMKEKENLASTNQLIRFIRGDVKYEEFYDHPPQTGPNRKPMMIIYGACLLPGLLFILAGYLFLSRQLKFYQSQLTTITTNLKATRLKSLLPEDVEANKAFGRQQKRLYEDLLNEKLSMSCVLKELSYIIPADILLKKIFLKNSISPQLKEKKGDILSKKLLFEGSVIKGDINGDGDLSRFSAQLKQSPFFQKVQVTYQNELNSNFRHTLDFILTCDLL